MAAVDALLASPWLLFGLFVVAVVAIATAVWLALGRAEDRARAAADREGRDLAFEQLSDANGSILARRDLLDAAVAALPAGIMLRDAAGQLLAHNERGAAFAGLPGGGDIRKLPGGGLVEVRRANLPDGASLELYFEREQPPLPPPAAAEIVAIADRAANDAPPQRRRRRTRVLLVEDIKVNQVVAATALRRDGEHVDIASSGAEAIEMARKTPYDLVLMDLMMPGMSGFDAARGIRALPGPPATMPIFALTATASQTDRTRCRDAGMQGMLTKPVRPRELENVLAGLLQPQGFAEAAPTISQADRLLDAVRLAELQRGLPAGLFGELLEEALGDMSVRMGALHAALAGGLADPIITEAHALAGIAGSYGLLAFERQMRHVLAAATDPAAARQAADGMVADRKSVV